DTTADGVKIVADGHTIMATPDAISIDGKTQNFDPTQDVEITIDESGAMQAKGLSAAAPGPNDEDAPAGGGSDASPPQWSHTGARKRSLWSSRGGAMTRLC